jgi:membrane protease YdiL (CAAX protease family)
VPVRPRASCKPGGSRVDPVVGLWLIILICAVPSIGDGLSHHLPLSAVIIHALSSFTFMAGEIALALFLIQRSGQPVSEFGVTWPLRRVDFIHGALAFGAVVFVQNFAAGIVSQLQPEDALPLGTALHPQWAYRPRSPLTWTIPSASYLFAAFAEELVFRGYLLTQLERVLNSTWGAWFVSSLLFSAAHLSQGTYYATVTTVVGMFLGGVFSLSRRIWPVTIAHAGINLLPSILFDSSLLDVPTTYPDWAAPAKW